MTKYKDFDIELAKEKDYDEIEKLFTDIISKKESNLNYRDDFKLYPAFVAKKNGKIVAFYTSYLGNSKEHDIIAHLPNESLTNFGIIEYCFVIEEYRGNGLQAFLGKKLVDYIFKKNNNIDRIYTAVHPQNIAGLRSLKKIGFQGFGCADLYGGKEGFILVEKEY